MEEFNNCGFAYDEMWKKCCLLKEISQKDFDKWLADHCYKCKYMSDVCMAGEEV